MPVFRQDTLDFISHSEAQTRRLGARLAAFLTPGDVLALQGDLGSGKTRWVQGVCQGLGVTGPVNSPTFTLVNEYQGRCLVYHIDLYRLEDGPELLTFGLEEYLYGPGVSLIEWAERAAALLPEERLTAEFHHLGETKRRIVLQANGPRFLTVLASFKEAVFTQHSTS
jgi:tRNA threonylcarbamoyladenosine biosynthesis protein TsaE